MWQPQSAAIFEKGRGRRGRSGFDPEFGARSDSEGGWMLGMVLGSLASAVWFVITLPFRLVFGVFALLGRLAGVLIGFALMVVGMALCAGPFVWIGLPLFIVGLVLTLRSLG